MEASVPLRSFRFRFVSNGRSKGMFSSKGYTTAQGISLAGELLPYESIKSAAMRDKLFVIGFLPDTDFGPKLEQNLSSGNYLVMDILDLEREELMRVINGAISHRVLKESSRSSRCPRCGAAIDSSGLPLSAYEFCPYCETLFKSTYLEMEQSSQGGGEMEQSSQGGEIVNDGELYRICPECNLFAHVRLQGILYLTLFRPFSPWSFQQKRLCKSCARKVFWRMLLLNAPFLLALPHTFLLFVRTFTGKDSRLKGLPKANGLLKRGRVNEAAKLFEEMRRSIAEHPGLLYNQAVGLLEDEKPSAALDCIQRSLEACSNYGPSLEILRRIENFIDGTVEPRH